MVRRSLACLLALAALPATRSAGLNRLGMPFGVHKFLSGPSAARLRPVLANSPELLRLVSWLSSDMLVLQSLAAMSGAGGIAAAATLGAAPIGFRAALAGPCRWQALFLAINTGQAARLALERRPARLNDVEARAYGLLFGPAARRAFRKPGAHAMTEVAFRRFMKETGATPVVAPAGTPLTREGRVDTRLDLILAGRCVVRRDRRAIGDLRAGAFVGEVSFVREADAAEAGADAANAPSSATVVVAQPGAELVRWRNDKLHDYFDRNPDHCAVFERLFSRDLSRKIDH